MKTEKPKQITGIWPFEQPPATDDKQWTLDRDLILCGGKLIAHSHGGEIPNRMIVDAHNEAIEAELEKHSKEIGELFDVARKWEDKALSAQAAISEHNNRQRKHIRGNYQINVDLSALERHDAEVRLPLATALDQIAKGLSGSCGRCQDCDSVKAVAENALLWTSASDALAAHDAEVRKPLVDALQISATGDKSLLMIGDTYRWMASLVREDSDGTDYFHAIASQLEQIGKALDVAIADARTDRASTEPQKV